MTGRKLDTENAPLGDAATFGVLVRVNQAKLRSFMLRLTKGDATLADDLAQETFLEAFRKLPQYRGDAPFRSWLFSIAYSRFLMHLRQRQFEDLEAAENEVAQDAQKGSDLRIDLAKAMNCLSAPENAALTLCYALQFSHEEASAILELPLGTVKSHILRGREKLKSLLNQAGMP